MCLLQGQWESGSRERQARGSAGSILDISKYRDTCERSISILGGTVEPLTNDHPHQRPSLSYDHISCDGQWFMFVYESLTSDHPSYMTTPMWFWGWSYKRGSTVSRYFDISNIEWINDQSDDTWAIYKYRVSNEISSIVWYDSWSLKPDLYFECKSTPYTVICRPFCALGARFPGHQCRSTR